MLSKTLCFQGTFDDPQPRAPPVTAAPKERMEMVLFSGTTCFDFSLLVSTFNLSSDLCSLNEQAYIDRGRRIMWVS